MLATLFARVVLHPTYHTIALHHRHPTHVSPPSTTEVYAPSFSTTSEDGLHPLPRSTPGRIQLIYIFRGGLLEELPHSFKEIRQVGSLRPHRQIWMIR